MAEGTKQRGSASWIVAAVAALVVVPLLAFGIQSGRCADLATEVGAESSCTTGPAVGAPAAWVLTLAAVAFAAYAASRAGRPAVTTAVVAVPLGLAASSFGFLGWSAGPLMILFGIFGHRVHHPWARWVIGIGVGLTLGTLLYIGLGLLIPDGPSTGGASGTPD